MQDRTINNALLALRKQGGTQGKLAEVLLDMRGVPLPSHYQNQPLGRNGTKRIILDALREGPRSTPALAAAVLEALPQQLAERIGDKEANVRNKLSRGKFSAAFLLHCLSEIGVSHLQIE